MLLLNGVGFLWWRSMPAEQEKFLCWKPVLARPETNGNVSTSNFSFEQAEWKLVARVFNWTCFDFEILGDFVDFDDFSRLLDFIELKIDFRLRLDFRERSDFDNESWTIFWRKMWILWELLSSYQTRDQVFFRDFLKWRKLQLLQKAQQHQQ